MATKKTTKKATTKQETSKKPDAASIFLDMTKDVGFSNIGSTNASDIDDFLPTFLPSLDLIMGGGIPFRRMSEIYGSAGVGKSTFLVYLTMIASNLGIPIAWIDTEGTTGSDRMSQFNLDMRYIQIYDIKSMKRDEILSIEKVDEIIEGIIDNYLSHPELDNLPAIILWDGVAGTVSQEEADTAIDKEGRMGRSASAITKLVKRVTPKLNKCNISMIMTNQVRANVNAMSAFAKKTTRAGGAKSLDHAETVRLGLNKGKSNYGMTAISRGATDNNGRNVVGHEVKFTADKNKAGIEQQSTIINIYTSELLSAEQRLDLNGFDIPECVFTDAEKAGVVKGGGSGGYYKYTNTTTGEMLNMRRKDFLVKLHEDDDLMKDLYANTLMFYFPHRYPAMNNKNIDVTKFKYWSDVLTKKYQGVTTGTL